MPIPNPSPKQRVQFKKVRALGSLKKSQRPTVRKRGIRPLCKRRVIAAIKDTGGLKSLIADRLGCAVATVTGRLRDPDWADVLAVYEEEEERVGDLAEETVITAIGQTEDRAEATRNARWFLERKFRKRGYEDVSRMRVDGGRPIEVHHTHESLAVLNLPIALRREILERIEERERKLLEAKAILVHGDNVKEKDDGEAEDA